MSEREFTDGLAAWFGPFPPDVSVGIGDDAAVLDPRADPAVITCDPVVEGVHFDAGAAWRAVGRKAVLRNLSDLAAMGARPHHAVVSVLFPANRTDEARRRELFEGLRSAARDHGCAVVGGDVGVTHGPLVVTVTAVGVLADGRAPLRRDAARVGDSIHLTGGVGGAVASGRHLEPLPRIDSGAWLAASDLVFAAIDVSDGLALDLATLCRASGVGAELYASELPIHPDAQRAAEASGDAAFRHALGDGEDYELLFTCRGGDSASGRLAAAGSSLSSNATRPIGRILAEPGLWWVDSGGARTPLDPSSGFEHAL